jgi:NAD(P)-dependent dehydrogenase (short-subunit alcohol dehydrogenase family)
MRELSGRVAVVTGGASGIGYAMSERFAAERMKVVVADIEDAPLQRAVDKLRSTGADAVGVRTDVSRLGDIEGLAERTIEAFGAVHVLCNNAGVESGALFTETSLKTFEWVFAVNFWGVLYGCRTFIPLMRQQDEAHIVNTGSLASFATGAPTLHPYMSSKFAVAGLTENLEFELRTMGDQHIGMSLLVPGPIRTRMGESERNKPQDVPATADDPVRKAISENIDRDTAAHGLDPSAVADLVVEGIREKRFFLLTHPEMAIGALQRRIDWMHTGTPPEVTGPVQD